MGGCCPAWAAIAGRKGRVETLQGDERLPRTLPDSQEHQSGLGRVAWDVFAPSSLLYSLDSGLKKKKNSI